MMLSRRYFLTFTVLGGLAPFLARRALTTVHCPILMYHYISYPPENADAVLLDLTVTPELFSEHLAYLQEKGFTTITFAQLWSGFLGETTLPEKPIILTFDDGYDNAYAHATPRLLERGMVGTFFIVGNFMGQAGYLNWGQTAEMQLAGMEIGNHSTNHPNLTTLDYDAQYAEAEQTAALMEANLGMRPTVFCYPLGKYNQNSITALKNTGHKIAVTTSDGTLLHAANPYRFPRVRVRHTTSVSSLDWSVNRQL